MGGEDQVGERGVVREAGMLVAGFFDGGASEVCGDRADGLEGGFFGESRVEVGDCEGGHYDEMTKWRFR